MIKNEIPQPLSSAKLLAPEFISKLRQDKYFVDDLLMEIEEKAAVAELGLNSVQPGLNKMIRCQTAIRVVRQWTGLSNDEVKAGLYDPEIEEQLPLVQQAVASLSSAWLEKDLVPPNLQVKQISRRTGLSPEKIIRLVDMFQPEMENGVGNYLLTVANFDVLKPVISGDYSPTLKDTCGLALSPKRILKDSRYRSRPPGGGPVQRARLQDKNIPGVIRTKAIENARISLQPPVKISTNQSSTETDQGGFSRNEDAEDINEVIDWLKQKGGKKWLRGTDETELTKVLQELSEGRETDVLFWNCFEFDWRQDRSNGYPACVIEDNIDTSIVVHNLGRISEALDWLSLLGQVLPIALVPTNEVNAPVWNYVQTPEERERVVNSVADKLCRKISEAGLSIGVRRWDDYLASRGINTTPEEFSKKGSELIIRTLSLKQKARMVEDDQKYFSQFEIQVPKSESGKRVPYYYGVYVGEGQAFNEIAKSGRNIILLDLEEFRVGKMTALGADGSVPIVSPLSSSEKLAYYRWKKEFIRIENQIN